VRLYSKIINFQNDIDENMHKTTKQLPNYALNTNVYIKPPTTPGYATDDMPPVELVDMSFFNNIDINEYSNKSIQDLSNVFIFSDENNPFSQFSSMNPN
jgi:hypothetical protein